MAAKDMWLYSEFGKALLKGEISPLADNDNTVIKVALLADTYEPAQGTHTNWGAIKAHEVTGEGYDAGGAEILNKAVTRPDNGAVSVFDGDDVEWTDSTITARWAVIYDATPEQDADKKLIAYIDFDGELSSHEGLFQIRFHTDGILKLTVATPA